MPLLFFGCANESDHNQNSTYSLGSSTLFHSGRGVGATEVFAGLWILARSTFLQYSRKSGRLIGLNLKRRHNGLIESRTKALTVRSTVSCCLNGQGKNRLKSEERAGSQQARLTSTQGVSMEVRFPQHETDPWVCMQEERTTQQPNLPSCANNPRQSS